MSDEFKNRSCKGLCKKYQVKKSTSGRYATGQARCQICQIWISHKGCHVKGGKPATEDSLGWFCNCCNYRVRTRPRNKAYKEKLIQKLAEKPSDSKHVSRKENQNESLKTKPSKEFEYIKNSNQTRTEVKNEGGIWNKFKRIIVPKTTPHEVQPDKTIPVKRQCTLCKVESIDVSNIGGYNICQKCYKNNSEGPSNLGRIKEMQKFDTSEEFIKNETGKLRNNIKNEKNQSLEEKEDFINAYFHFGTIKKVSEVTNRPEKTVRMYVQTSKRLPPKLREAHNKSILSMDPKLSLNIALHATDFYGWDGEAENQDAAYELAIQIAKYIKKSKI